MADDERETPQEIEKAPEGARVAQLTPEQQEELRKSLAQVQQFLSRTAASLSVNSEALVAVARAQQVVAESVAAPLLSAQSAMQKQLSTIINSDLFKTRALLQANLNGIAEQLIKNVDFRIGGMATGALSNFAGQYADFLANVQASLVKVEFSFYPPNLREIKNLKFEQVESVVMVDGIPLYGIPRASTAEELIIADSASKRRMLLEQHWKSISEDCRELVAACTAEFTAPYVPFVVAALDALDAGHAEAAQALASSLIDALVGVRFGDDRKNYTPDRSGKRTTEAYDDLEIHEFIAFAPLWQAYQQFFVEKGDAVPETYSRHATAHTVSPRQYNRCNAMQALMFACSMLSYLDFERSQIRAA
ncbi:hypothetical protein [Saccharothrix lopnurensis]|uniref:Uncharacterized protein n=1 Tax=Saccharothrix lopnurensis TaxID=1670621 RepID=A0ABW1NXM7_9PSEU